MKKRAWLLVVFLALSLLPACALLQNPFPEWTEEAPTDYNAAITESTAPLSDNADDVFVDFSPANLPSGAALAQNRESFLALYSPDQLSQNEISKKAADVFTDAFFERYTVVVVSANYPYTRCFCCVDSFSVSGTTVTVSLSFHRPFDDPTAEDKSLGGHIILILDKTDPPTETAAASFTNAKYASETEINRDVAMGVLFSGGEYEKLAAQKRAQDLATLDKYKP
jgi:hypothetical protein